MNHLATPRFWDCYYALPIEARATADKCFALLQADSRHPSLRFKPIGDIYSVRVGLRYRALATQHDGDIIWFWIGTHAQYDKLIG